MAETTAGTESSSSVTSSQEQSSTQSVTQAGAVTTSGKDSPAASSSPGNVKSSATLTAKLIQDPEAFLARARERSGLKPREKPAAAKTEQAAAPAASPQAAEALPKVEEKPKTGETPDEMAARMARFSREEREAAARRKAWDEEQARTKAEWEERQKQHEAKLKQAETVEKAAKMLEGGDISGAMRLLKADINPSALALQLLEQLQKEDERTMSPAEVERMIAEQLKAEQAARAKAEEEAKKAAEEKRKAEDNKALESAKDNYFTACKGEFSKEKFPFIAKRGLDRDSAVNYAMSVRDDAGRLAPPSPEEVLKHFEAKFKAEAEVDGFELVPKVAKPAAPTAPTMNPSSLVQDSGARIIQPKRTTLEDKRAEIRARLRAGGAQS